MASQAAIDDVLHQLPDEVGTLGITSNDIAAIIDTGVSNTKVMLAVWRVFAGKVSTVVDISESGSSRANGVLFDRAKQMIDYWQTRSDEEDKQNEITPVRAHAYSYRAVRV